jgi:quaternary ammonium compound-resistance protein SugE
VGLLQPDARHHHGVDGGEVSWALLVVAGLLEVGWAVGLKYTDGFTRPVPTALVIVAMTASVWLLAIALRTIPVGTGYAVWTGIGAVGTAILGMFLFGESRDVLRILSILLIVAGIAGLKLVTPA